MKSARRWLEEAWGAEPGHYGDDDPPGAFFNADELRAIQADARVSVLGPLPEPNVPLGNNPAPKE